MSDILIPKQEMDPFSLDLPSSTYCFLCFMYFLHSHTFFFFHIKIGFSPHNCLFLSLCLIYVLCWIHILDLGLLFFLFIILFIIASLVLLSVYQWCTILLKVFFILQDFYILQKRQKLQAMGKWYDFIFLAFY